MINFFWLLNDMSCKIMLSNCNGLYVTGSTIIGKVICYFPTLRDVREVRVKLKGTEMVRWKRGKHVVRDENKFLEEKTQLASEGRLGPGRVEYPFTFTLPLDIPTSYGGKYGWVTYSLKATVDKPFDFDYTDKLKLPVILPLDLNKLVDRTMLSPGIYTAHAAVSDCCCRAGNIAMEVRLEKKAIASGETIKVGVRIMNMSKKNVEKIQIELKMAVNSSVHGFLGSSSREEKFLVAEIFESGCGAHGEKYCDVLLKVPLFDAVPNFYKSKLLSFRSKLKVTAVTPVFTQNLIINIPICLGDIPVGGEEEFIGRVSQHRALGPDVSIRTMGLYNS